MQRRWVSISLWPNMGNMRFSLSVVTNVATEPNSLDRIYRDTVSVLTGQKLEPTSALKWEMFGFHLVSFSNKVLASHLLTTFFCLHCSSLSQECFFFFFSISIVLTHSKLDTITHTPYVRKTKKICTGEVQRHKHALTSATTLWMKGNHSQALTDISWQAQSPPRQKCHVSHVLWWWWQWWWGRGGVGGRVLRGCFLSFTALSWRRRILLWGSTSATQRWRTASCSQGWDLSSPHTWWSQPGGWTQNISNIKQEEDTGL